MGCVDAPLRCAPGGQWGDSKAVNVFHLIISRIVKDIQLAADWIENAAISAKDSGIKGLLHPSLSAVLRLGVARTKAGISDSAHLAWFGSIPLPIIKKTPAKGGVIEKQRTGAEVGKGPEESDLAGSL